MMVNYSNGGFMAGSEVAGEVVEPTQQLIETLTQLRNREQTSGNTDVPQIATGILSVLPDHTGGSWVLNIRKGAFADGGGGENAEVSETQRAFEFLNMAGSGEYETRMRAVFLLHAHGFADVSDSHREGALTREQIADYLVRVKQINQQKRGGWMEKLNEEQIYRRIQFAFMWQSAMQGLRARMLQGTS